MPEDEKIELEIVEHEYEDIQDEYDEYEEPDEENLERVVAVNTWDLHEALPLARKAADWYLLYSLWLDDNDETDRFMSLTRELCGQFAPYADMVVGGELRYTLGHVADAEYELPEALYDVLRYNFNNASRSDAWEAWKTFRAQHATNALLWAESAFESFGSNSHTYGGSKWAYIARTVRMYETGEITPIMFVDMCWGLEHNGGQFFGKLWNTFRLKTVLDFNLNDDLAGLLSYASPDVALLSLTKVDPNGMEN
jgi:hypothetical protein